MLGKDVDCSGKRDARVNVKGLEMGEDGQEAGEILLRH